MLILKDVYLNGKTTDILINGANIEKIAPNITLDGAEILSCKNKAILPSFCNMHTHAAMMFLRGIGEDLPLFEWLENKIWPLEDRLTPEYVYHISKFAILEMIRTGTTMFLDMYFETPQTGLAASEMGMRGALTFTAMDMFDKDECKRRIERAQAFLDFKMPSDLIMKGLSPHAIYTTSKELYTACKDMTRRCGTFLNTHVSETRKEVNDCLEKYGKRPVELLEDWGIVDENTILAHAVHLNNDEMDLIVKKGSVVAHNPISNMKLDSGQMHFRAMQKAGVKLTLGTDGVSSNNNLSMIDEMKVAALSAKIEADDTTAAKVDDIFDMATKNGFEALGLKAGQIKEGFLADFILVDMNCYQLLPATNLISNMVYSADSACITDVFCNGQKLMSNRVVKGEDEIIKNFKNVCQELLKDA